MPFGGIGNDAPVGVPTDRAKPLRAIAGERRVRQLNFDLLRLLEGDRQGSHGTHRARRYVPAQAAETLHRLGYRGLRARGFKGRHIEALVAEWQRQGLSDGTIKNRIAHLRWLAKKIGKPGIVRRVNASYGIGPAAEESEAGWLPERRTSWR